jgi:hypothetical protein
MLRLPTVVAACLALTSAVLACGRDPTAPSSSAASTTIPGLSPTPALTTAVDQTVATVTTQPDSLLMIVGDKASVSAQVLNQAGEALARSVTWNVQTPSLVNILTKTGTTVTFKARKKGITSIRATVDGKSGSTKLVIRDATGARVIVTPASATVAPLETVQFAAAGLTQAGETATVSATWSATGGTISATGFYTAGKTGGVYRVIAKTPFGAADTSDVTITSAPITQLVVTPATVTLAPGETQQFASYGINSLGDHIAAPTTWTADGGSITGDGLYTAGDVSGTYEVKGTVTGTSISASAWVTTEVSSPSAATGIPFGLFGMLGRRLVDPYTSGVQAAQPDTILVDLAAAKARGARIIVNFAGGSNTNLTDAAGHFDYEKWKIRVDRFLPTINQLNAYVADGTLLAFMMIDEPFAPNSWGGEVVPMATLDQMAQYSRSIFPDLLTAVRAAPSALQSYAWQYLDVSWAQYTARKGPIDQYVSTEVAAAKAAGLGLVVGLNISKGGDGSSGLGTTNEWSMSGNEILQYGHALLDAPYACAFESWDSRSSVIDQPDVAAALQELAVTAAAHVQTPCGQ